LDVASETQAHPLIRLLESIHSLSADDERTALNELRARDVWFPCESGQRLGQPEQAFGHCIDAQWLLDVTFSLQVTRPDPALAVGSFMIANALRTSPRYAAVPGWRACTFEVTDETGSLVLTLPFAEVGA
jgi:hypothetical protein